MKVKWKFSKNPLSGTKYKIITTKKSLTDSRVIKFEYVEGSSAEIKDLKKDDVVLLESDFIAGNREDLMIIDSIEDDVATLRGYQDKIMGIREFEDGENLLFIARVEYE